MPCYHPIPASQDQSGARVVLYPKGHVGDPSMVNLKLPCGNCLGCRSTRANEWARRCVHEARCFERNSFVTLTYNDDWLPVNGWLEPVAFTKFMKRLRKRVPGVRYFACGEYGSTTGRPHYHALLFNCGFDDTSRVGKDLFESDMMSDLWKFGEHRLGAVTGASANYIAKYSLKKLGVDYGEAPPPFLRMSLKPAIGHSWLARFSGDLKHGYMVVDGRKCRIPRSYMKRLSVVDGAYEESVDFRSYEHVVSVGGDGSDPARLRDGEVIHARRLELSDSHLM